MTFKKFLAVGLTLLFLGIGVAATIFIGYSSSLPSLITAEDYSPLLVTEVYDRNEKKIGEFFRERRTLVDYEDIPEKMIHAFISSEDAAFFEHGGVNYMAILRAVINNIRKGRKGQGGSTITQQVARSLLLSSEKTYTRKIKEALLSYRMEDHLTKKEILWLYLNQIYLGQGAYGVEAAAQIYFRKPVKDLTVPESALIAGLPQAPSRYSPISNPKAAKERQTYVLNRMAEEGYLTKEEANKFIKEPLKVYLRKNFKEKAPFYLETLRQLLVTKLGEKAVLDEGLQVYTGLDLDKQMAAQEEVREGLRGLDKRQGFRGAKNNISEPEAVAEFLQKSRDSLIFEASPFRIIQPDGTIESAGPLNLTGLDEKGEPLPTLPSYVKRGDIVPGLVTKVDDEFGLVSVRFAESKGLIDIETMEWARKPDPTVRADYGKIKKPSQALKVGDVVDVKITNKSFRSSRLKKLLAERKSKKKKAEKKSKKKDKKKKADLEEEKPEVDTENYAELELEQEPQVEGSLVSLDQKSGDILALVGGYDFSRSEFNRALQAARQTGSAFKALVYGAALDKGYTAATPILDAPVVYEEAVVDEGQDPENAEIKKWKPHNHSKKFEGEILFRNALIRSLNIPTVKVIEKIGVPWVAEYARRLGIFSPLNMDFTLGLGSSGVTLYEMTKVFAQINRMGQRIRPIIVHKVNDQHGKELLGPVSLDERFESQIAALEEEFETRRQKALALKNKKPEGEAGEQNSLAENGPALYFQNPDQLMSPQTSYILTSLLQGVIEERKGTGGAARSIGRPAAGKTGTTSGYFDAWFMGFTPDITTGVWVGFDEERTLGKGEVGGRSALPIWLEYMKKAHQGIPERNFPVPEGIVFANIDNLTGRLASPGSETVVRQAFKEGTEPSQASEESSNQADRDFFKEDLSE